ncbi:tetraspanin-7-like [Ostrinia furnacalis]|uniref:tetraspanin-7-like n=1 Tax=Ostrinia furnacalis TaxID=93504 RepID=UPI00103A121E|nr:tetraspanin-7-like [Ostrinia furnacalis]
MAALQFISTVLNILQTILSIALACVSMWFFVELKNITDLRNKDRYLLDFTLYWPQVLPWVFLVISIAVIFVNLCGFYGICRKNKSSLYVYVVFLSLVTLAAFAAGVLGFTCADAKETDDFISGAVSDAYSEMKVRKEVIDAFSNIERRLRCCGIQGSSDYTQSRIPPSCCDYQDAAFCENAASRRLGCAQVAVPYTRMFMRYTSVASLAIAILSVGSLIVAILLVRSRKSKSDRFNSTPEQEPLKVPL